MEEHSFRLVKRQGIAGLATRFRALWWRVVIAVLFALATSGMGATVGVAAAETISAEHVAVTQQAKVLPADGAAADFFGECVAISGDTMVVGAPASASLVKAGSAYVFVRTGGVWLQQAKLVADDAGAADVFGSSVAIEGDTVVVGAPGDDGRIGAAYVFTRAGGTWTQRAKLTASDGLPGDNFGQSVAISAERVVVGAPYSGPHGVFSGSAYVFLLDPLGWVQLVKLTASDGAAQDRFGQSVAINGDSVVVGAPYADAPGADSGAVYVFVRSVMTWFQSKLTAADGGGGDRFGESVAISGDTVIIGATLSGHPSMEYGCAYVFDRSTGSWIQSKLTSTDGTPGDHFGFRVAVNGDTAVIGALHDSSGAASSGSAYVFVKAGGTWTRLVKLSPVDRAVGDQFGSSVAISANTLVVGAACDDSFGDASGSAYVSLLNEPPLADAGPDQEVPPSAKVTLNAANSRDRDNTIASFQWKQLSGPRVHLSNPRANQATFIAPEVGAKGATLAFQVKVVDPDGASATDACLVTVTVDNRGPLAKAGGAQRVLGGSAITLNGNRSRDPDGTALKYRWKQISGPPVALSGRSSPQATFTAPTVGWCGTSLRFRLTVTDRAGLKAEDTTLVNVCAGNRPPKARAGRRQTVSGGTRVHLDGSASSFG
jgi:hypothetical protein